MTENKIAPTQDLEELYRLYKHERDDRIMLREESGQLSPELRLKVHLSKTHGTDSSGSIYICLTFPQNILFVELKKRAIFMRLRSKLSLSFMTKEPENSLFYCLFCKITPWHLTLNATLLIYDTAKFLILKLFS